MAPPRLRFCAVAPTWCAVAAVALVLLSASACSTNKTDTVNAGDAAGTVASIYSLSDDQKACLETAFRAHAEATHPLATAGGAHDADIEALGAVEVGCIPTDTLSDVLAAGAASGFGELTDQQRSCVPATVGGLSDADRGLLLAGFTVPQESLSDAKAVAFGQVVNHLLDSCGLSIDGTGTTGPGDTAGATGSTAGG
jgi:hypothetical protein